MEGAWTSRSGRAVSRPWARTSAWRPNGARCRWKRAAAPLLLPGLVEGHAHLDKTTWGSSWYVNDVGSALTDRIDNERDWRAASGHDAHVHSQALALAFLRLGTTRIRTHVDVDTEAGLRHLTACWPRARRSRAGSTSRSWRFRSPGC